MRRSRRLPIALLSTTLLLASAVACGDDVESEASAPTSSERPAPSSTSSTSTTAPEPRARMAQARGDEIDLFADAAATEPARRLTAAEATSAPGIPIVFLVKDEADDRFEVYLPVRPNGSTGWVDRADVDVAGIDHRVEVDVGNHRLRVFDGDVVVVDEPIGVGRDDRPTPGGVYYIKELLQPPDPDGVYGPYAYGLSGFSNVLDTFGGGQAVIGIHGTNEPDAIGRDVSSGCIRVSNDVITRLVEQVGLPLGTPVDVLA